MPYAINQVSEAAPRHLIPTCISSLMGCMNLGMFVSNYVVGFLAGLFGTVTIFSQFATCAVLAVVAAVLAVFLYAPRKRTV